MFGMLMKYWIGCDVSSTYIIHMKWYRTILRKTILGKQTMEKMTLEHADDITRYSAPVEDFETQSCSLHFHNINELARCIHQLDVGCQELGIQPIRKTLRESLGVLCKGKKICP